MDKSAIRNFAIEARKMLMKSAETEAGFYGVTKNGCKSPIQKGNDFEVYETIAGTENRIYGADIKRRANLVKAVETLGFEQVMEETAYTWFNRIIAIRFMEVNDYLPTRVRVLSSETGSNTPDIVTQFLDVDLNMMPEELEKVQKAKDENRYDDAFRMLFIKQCNELNAILPGLFEKTDDYMELLLKLSYTSDGVVRMLVDSIDENNFNVETEGQVEIIGWMYQYYNTELKDDTFAKLKKNVKITKERIPAATQLFTPDWIVRYMVENSVGRVWIEHLRAVNPSIDEKEKAEEFGWKYYLPEAEQEDSVAEKLVEIRKDYAGLEPKDITCIDPCMGSGHILVYMFDVLMDIYRSEGFSERDAVFSILKNNIRGLDIDKRAYQLSYFALMMKARGYNRTFFRGKQDEEGNRRFVEPMVLAVEESNTINLGQLKYFGANLNEIEKNNAINQMQGLLEALRDAKEYGSILAVDNYDWELLLEFADSENTDGQISFDTLGIELTQSQMKRLICQGRIMSNKYCVVSTNPPYMGISNGNAKLNAFVKKNYPNSKADLFAVFIERCGQMMKENGYQAMITQHAWMFLSSFEKLRSKLQMTDTVNMAHLGARAFEEIGGEVVQTTSFVMRKSHIAEYRGTYCRLIEPTTQKGKEEMYLAGEKRYTAVQDNFTKIPGSPVAYWASPKVLNGFLNQSIGESMLLCQGLTTTDNEKYVRYWQELDIGNIGFSYDSKDAKRSGKKWFPFNKGGAYCKWYGNNELVVNYKNDGEEIKSDVLQKYKYLKTPDFVVKNSKTYFEEGLTWSALSNDFSIRWFPQGAICADKGQGLFAEKDILYYVCGFLNSCVTKVYLQFISPTLDFNCGYIRKLPFRLEENEIGAITSKVKENIVYAQQDWDSFETSWDFSTHPFLQMNQKSIEMDNIAITKISDSYGLWKAYTDIAFEKLKHNEAELNRIFIDIYGLQDELTPEVEDKDITVRKADLGRDIRSFISYAVGCMFGRYSLNQDGLMFAGGNMKDTYAYYGGTFADTANIRMDGQYTLGELGTPFYYFPVDGKEPLECWKVDADNVIPITDEEYFADDIVNRFAEFVKAVYGEESLEENLEFIASVLGNKSFSSREAIRNYFLKDFFKDHCKIYQKRPIYWLFDSGKQNGFKCLIYMHRYNKDTLNLIRSEYLHKTQNAVENALKNAEYIIQSSTSAVERAKATKDRDRYVKQLNEMRIYYQALSHLALQKIEIDLDDGVKHNYQLFQNIEVIVDGGKKQKVDLLAKI